jgi:hypothetical protein
MARPERPVGRKEETPLEIAGSSILGSDQQREHVFTPEEAEYQRYSELLRGFFEKFFRWQEILAADECQTLVGHRGFSVYRSEIGSIIRPGWSLEETDDFKDQNEILRIDSQMVSLRTIQFNIRPMQAGRHLLTDPEDHRALDNVDVELHYLPNAPSRTRLITKSVRIQTQQIHETQELRVGEDFYRSFYREVNYEFRGDTLTVSNGFQAVDYYSVMTNETAASIINTIDSLIPQANPQLPEQAEPGQ